MKSTVFFAALTTLMSACAGQTYSVTLRDSGGTTVGTPITGVTSGGSVTLTATAFGTPTLTLSQVQSVRRIDVEATIVGGVTASIGTIDVQLADPSPAGSTLLVVKGPTTGSYCGSLGSVTSTTGRPLNLQLSVGGDLTGTVRGDSATFIDVIRTLSGTLHIDHGAVIGTSSLSPSFGQIATGGMLYVHDGSLTDLTVVGVTGGSSLAPVIDGSVILNNGTLARLTIGTATSAGRIGGTLAANSSGAGVGRIDLIRGDSGGAAPVIGATVVSGDPTVPAKIFAKNGIGRITGSKVRADILASGGFQYTRPDSTVGTADATDKALLRLRCTDWFNGSIAAAQFRAPDTGETLTSTEYPGISVAGTYAGTIKLGNIGYIGSSKPAKIEVGSVPTDPSGGVWLDLTDSDVLGPLASGNRGVITGQATGDGTTSIAATNGRLGSIKARAIVPTAPGTGFSTTLLSTPHISSTGTMGRITTARLSGEGGTTVNGQNFQAGDCMAVIKAGTSTAASTIDGIDTDGRLEGTIDALSIGDSTIKGGTTGSLIAGTQGGDLSVFILTEGVRSGNVFRTQRFANASSGDQFKVAQGAPGSPGLIIYNADMSQAAGNDFGWQQPLVVATTSLSGRSTSSTGPSREFGTNHVKSQFRYTGANTSNVRGFTAGGAPFGLMIYDSYPSGRVGFDAPAVDLTTFLDGTTPIRLRYNGPVTLPSGGGGLIIEENTQTGWVDATAKFTVELGGSQPTREIVLKPAHCTGFQGVTNRFRVRYGASTVPRPLCDKLLTTSAVTVFEREEYGTASQTGSATPIQFTFRFVGCNDADVGQQGGIPGPDCTLNNNDFIVFIDMFFNHDPAADIGQQGGVSGADGAWDNNDFVVFIDIFFSGGCEGCSGPLPSCFGEGSGGGGYVPPKEGEGEGENLMFGAPADPAAAFRAALQHLIDTTPAGARRDQLIDFLNALPPPSGDDDH